MASQVEKIRSFNRFYTRVLGLMNERLLESPLTLAEGRLLWEINSRRRCKAGDLEKLLGMDRGFLSRVLGRLEKAGLIVRRTDSQDRRVRLLSVTPRGRALLEELERRAADQIQGLVGGLSAQQRRRLVEAMERIQSILA